MADYREDIVDIELTGGSVHRSFMQHTIGAEDEKADRFGVRAFRNGQPVNITGACIGKFIRADGETVAISDGVVNGNVAYVTLPATCYAVEGQFTLAIKTTVTGNTATLRIVDGVVSRTSTEVIVDPGTLVDSVEDLIDAIEDAVATIPADYSAMWETFAPLFSSSTAYTAGQYVVYDGGLYRFVADHAAGAWNANHALPVKAGGELENANNAVSAFSGCGPIRLVPGKYIALNGSSVTMSGGVPVISGNSSAGYAVGMMPCAEGDVFFINGHGGSSTRLWAFIKADGTILSAESANATKSNLMVTAPENAAWIVIHTNDRQVSYKGFNHANMWQHNTVDILAYYQKKTETVAGVTYTWDGNACTVDGEASSNAFNFFTTYNDPTIPMIVPGGKYYVKFAQGAGGNVALSLVWHFTDTTVRREYYYADTEVTAPEGFDGVSIALCVKKGMEADNETVEVFLFTMTGGVGAVDDRVKNLEDSLAEFLPRNILQDFGTFESGTSFGVTYTWNADHETCVVDGTASGGTSYNFLWTYYDGIPEGIEPGGQYQVKFTSSVESAVGVHFYFLATDGESKTDIRFTNDAVVTIPEDLSGVSIRLDVTNGTVCDDVVVTLKLMTIETADIQSGVANHVSRMLSVGSSFMTGAIYYWDEREQKAKLDHLCSFDNSPYGNVAIGLGIEQKNVQHILMSGTGLLYVSIQELGNILNKLKSMDLSPYDYILTQFNRPDMGTGSNQGFPVGDLDSVAGDGTIVGAVLDLLAYMKTSNPNATLILVGAPPSATTDAMAYDRVFTAVYNNGASIGEADLMMHRLAVREHFIFIDWEDLNLSYYYKDLCVQGNVHPFADATCRTMGLYLARQCNYTASQAKVLRADAEG